MEAESVPTFPSPSTSFPLFNLQEKYDRLKRLTNTHIFYLQVWKVKFKVASSIIFVGYHHFEKGLSIYESFSDVGEIRVYFASKILTPCRMH